MAGLTEEQLLARLLELTEQAMPGLKEEIKQTMREEDPTTAIALVSVSVSTMVAKNLVKLIAENNAALESSK